jgi:hypothetical protein
MINDFEFYMTLNAKNDMEIMNIINNPDEYQKEYYYAAVEIGLQRGIISKKDFNEEYYEEYKKNVNEIVTKANASPRKPFNSFLFGLLFIIIGLVFIVMNLSVDNKFYDNSHHSRSLYHIGSGTAFFSVIIGVLLLIAGLISKIRKWANTPRVTRL